MNSNRSVHLSNPFGPRFVHHGFLHDVFNFAYAAGVLRWFSRNALPLHFLEQYFCPYKSEDVSASHTKFRILAAFLRAPFNVPVANVVGSSASGLVFSSRLKLDSTRTLARGEQQWIQRDGARGFRVRFPPTRVMLISVLHLYLFSSVFLSAILVTENSVR